MLTGCNGLISQFAETVEIDLDDACTNLFGNSCSIVGRVRVAEDHLVCPFDDAFNRRTDFIGFVIRDDVAADF